MIRWIEETSLFFLSPLSLPPPSLSRYSCFFFSFSDDTLIYPSSIFEIFLKKPPFELLARF